MKPIIGSRNVKHLSHCSPDEYLTILEEKLANCEVGGNCKNDESNFSRERSEKSTEKVRFSSDPGSQYELTKTKR